MWKSRSLNIDLPASLHIRLLANDTCFLHLAAYSPARRCLFRESAASPRDRKGRNETCTIEFCVIGDGEKGAEGGGFLAALGRGCGKRDLELSREAVVGCPGGWF